jgi:hypothetical protein
MPNYFDYIHESSYEDIDDSFEVFNEVDASLAEFDVYVQEGVGVNILIGVGIAAALAGIIALIVKLFSNKNGESAGKKVAKTKNAIRVAMKNGVNYLEIPLPKNIDITQKKLDDTVDLVERFNEFSGKYAAKVKDVVEQSKDATAGEMKNALEQISVELIQDFPELAELMKNPKLAKGMKQLSSASLSADKMKSAAKMAAHASAQRISADQCIAFTDRAMDVCKRLLRNGKLMDKNRGVLGKLLKGTGLDSKIEDKVFNRISAGITTYIKNCYDDIDGTCDLMIDYVVDTLEQVAPEVANTLKVGGTGAQLVDAGRRDIGRRSLSTK